MEYDIVIITPNRDFRWNIRHEYDWDVVEAVKNSIIEDAKIWFKEKPIREVLNPALIELNQMAISFKSQEEFDRLERIKRVDTLLYRKKQALKLNEISKEVCAILKAEKQHKKYRKEPPAKEE